MPLFKGDSTIFLLLKIFSVLLVFETIDSKYGLFKVDSVVINKLEFVVIRLIRVLFLCGPIS